MTTKSDVDSVGNFMELLEYPVTLNPNINYAISSEEISNDQDYWTWKPPEELELITNENLLLQGGCFIAIQDVDSPVFEFFPEYAFTSPTFEFIGVEEKNYYL